MSARLCGLWKAAGAVFPLVAQRAAAPGDQSRQRSHAMRPVLAGDTGLASVGVI
jgi:hypothetical protein